MEIIGSLQITMAY